MLKCDKNLATAFVGYEFVGYEFVGYDTTKVPCYFTRVYAW